MGSSNQEEDKKKEEQWGYDMYPERQQGHKQSFTSLALGYQGKGDIDKLRCEKHVYDCFKNSPLVKLMLGALKSSGCPIDLRRHIACEPCDAIVTGGYDTKLNQIVVCQNTSTSYNFVQGVLAHEMIHMFDYCRNHVDFRNLEHVACTEIRAANLTHCSFMSAVVQNDVSPFRIKAAHAECVKSKAAYSLMAVRDITMREARDIVNKVFPKCYADLEPVGRRLRRHSRDMVKAYMEGYLYGSWWRNGQTRLARVRDSLT